MLTEKQKHKFWKRVVKSEDCWVIKGAPSSDGYGQFNIRINNQKRIYLSAHRLSWVLHYGEIPDELWVLHKCDNKLCVNPSHLFLGTNQDNMDDMYAKGRGALTFKNVEIQKKATEKARSPDAIEKRKKTYAVLKHQQGITNSSFGTCLIKNENLKITKRIKKEELDNYLTLGWIKGAKYKW